MDFPNRGEPGGRNKNLGFPDYVETVTEQIKNWNGESFVLVGHSLGALVGIKVAEAFKTQVTAMVAIASVVPKSGNSFASALPFPQNYLLPPILGLLGTRPPESSIRSSLCRDLDPNLAEKIVREFTPEVKKLYTAKIEFTLPGTDRLYIKTTRDDLPENYQDRMAANFGADTVMALDSGHLPMLSHPKALADAIGRFT